ncbi:serine/threonine-protein kinase [Sandaracinus amylolyticus]|uniref:Serine/threonine protein kinase n=1 Tax=Sandaracinus amylolyticus TaxID=927083 RepID=A0A0F6SE26_9BACT|nr:serine/threonine-protein kinase [Sandaracinus amylolyticus]AKF04459.1 serine/threonine protein kinase [Sandaracinus amylolyticus]
MAARELSTPVPSRVGPYEIVGRIAAGGMAEVFAARAPAGDTTPRVVAIKQPRRDVVDERQFVEMFLDEARIASMVASPHCVETYALGADDEGRPYLVMPLVVGVSLSRLLAHGGALPPPFAAEIGAQIALGLHDAHRATGPDGAPLGIVHRDMSPPNVLVDVEGCARVADFGVAHAYARITRTRTGELKGKLGYFAPEQIEGAPVDARTDVFALGIVVWEMLTGRRLVHAKSYVDAYQALAIAPIPDVRERAPHVPADLAEVVARALRRAPAERFADAESFASALRASVTRPATTGELGALVRARAGADLRRLEALAAAAAGAGSWTIDVTALPRMGATEESTRLRGPIEDETQVSGPPRFDERRGVLARLRAWLADLFA